MNILEEADALINGDRASAYGDVTENFERIADFWTTYIGNVEPLSAYDVANMMILVKVARQKSGAVSGAKAPYHRDSVIDIAGYAALSEKLHEAILGPQVRSGLWTGTVFEDLVATLSGDTEDYAKKTRVPPQVIPAPRVWKSLVDVPKDVRVVDKSGDIWSFSVVRDQWGFRTPADNDWIACGTRGNPTGWDVWGPFTEVVPDD